MSIVHMSPPDTVPTRDGEVAYYSGASLRLYPMRPRNDQPVIYVPGIATQPFQHRISCQFLSALTEREVIGVYNLTEGMIPDVGQCAIDKFFKDIPEPTPHQERSVFTSPVYRLGQVREAFAYNPTVVSLTEVLLDLLPLGGRSDPVHVICHSQGCLITNLAVRACMYVRDIVVGPLHVFALASPSHNWLAAPGKIEIWRASYSQDPIAYLSATERFEDIPGSPKPYIELADRDPTDPNTHLGQDYLALRVHNPDMNFFMRYFVQEIRGDLGLGTISEGELDDLERAMKTSMYPPEVAPPPREPHGFRSMM